MNFPPGIKFMSATRPVSVDVGLDVVTWYIPTLQPGHSEGLGLAVTATSGITGCLLNVATVVSDTPDSNPRSNTAINCTLIFTLADLEMKKHGYPETVFSGGPLTYTLWVKNNGPSDAHDVVMTGYFARGIELSIRLCLLRQLN